ncbi:MAG: hypothetical protein Salg2KO_10420 [Salibacteraceae bacterium]
MIKFHYDTEEEIQVDIEQDTSFVLMLYNDDVNTFDHVIESLVDVCEHDVTQPEQCAYIVHTKGKCDVKRGSMETLEKMCVRLLNRKLSAKIEQ